MKYFSNREINILKKALKQDNYFYPMRLLKQKVRRNNKKFLLSLGAGRVLRVFKSGNGAIITTKETLK